MQENSQDQLLYIESVAKQCLTKEALIRYSNIKTVDNNRASQIAKMIYHLVKQNVINTRIDDQMLKNILKEISIPKKNSRITIK